MTSITIGIIGILVLIVVLMLGVPIGFTMALIGFAGFSWLRSFEAGLTVLSRDIWHIFSSYSLTVIPMFIFMGSVAYLSGMSKRFYDAGNTIFGQIRGSLAMGTILGCAAFAAICGSTTATAAAMGRVTLPEMKRYHYSDSLATGCVAAAGTLGILIPPSTVLIIYGSLTEQSIGQLFVAGICPGIILTLLFIAVVGIMVWLNPDIAPPGNRTQLKEKLLKLTGVIEMLILFGLCIGGLFWGWFSPTQAGAAGAAGALIIALVRRSIDKKKFLFAIIDCVKLSGVIMIILAGATIFGRFMAMSGIPMVLSSWAQNLALPKMMIVAVIVAIYFIGGCFMDALGLITITIPVFYPTILSLGLDPIWFGVIIVLVTEMGVITPPVGVNVYIIKSVVPEVKIETIFKGIFPFLIAQILAVILLMIFPSIATYLPGLIKY